MNKNERWAALFLILLSVAVIYYSLTKLSLGTISEPGSGFFPFVCGVGILLLCMIWFIANPKVDEETPAMWEQGAWVAPLLAMILIGLYTFGLEILGYCTATFIFLIAWQTAIVREKLVKTGIIALTGTTVMYLLFSYLLGVPLPEGFLI